MSERKPYPSDLSDEQWALIEPVITAWKAAYRSVSGHQGNYAMREIVNAILYQGRTSVQWDYLPHDLLRWHLSVPAHKSAPPEVGVKAKP
ncbi:transposase [Streptosporangium sp. NPDC000509]|uniref:transposase n=1 Tax=Streptosporangium sp. NPDC000509 TaxID=3366186 RepID=UPI0036AF307C